MYSSQDTTPSIADGIRRIWPSQNTADGANGGRGTKASGTSSLKHAIHEESMVMRLVFTGEHGG
jgi:hypothetical protein